MRCLLRKHVLLTLIILSVGINRIAYSFFAWCLQFRTQCSFHLPESINFFLNAGAPKFSLLSSWGFLKGQLFLKLQEGKSCIVSLRTKPDIYPECWAAGTVKWRLSSLADWRFTLCQSAFLSFSTLCYFTQKNIKPTSRYSSSRTTLNLVFDTNRR